MNPEQHQASPGCSPNEAAMADDSSYCYGMSLASDIVVDALILIKDVPMETVNTHEKQVLMDGKKLFFVISKDGSVSVTLQADDSSYCYGMSLASDIVVDALILIKDVPMEAVNTHEKQVLMDGKKLFFVISKDGSVSVTLQSGSDLRPRWLS
nr:hypothetical protein [Tanacetum cinerariifolium]